MYIKYPHNNLFGISDILTQKFYPLPFTPPSKEMAFLHATLDLLLTLVFNQRFDEKRPGVMDRVIAQLMFVGPVGSVGNFVQ